MADLPVYTDDIPREAADAKLVRQYGKNRAREVAVRRAVIKAASHAGKPYGKEVWAVFDTASGRYMGYIHGRRDGKLTILPASLTVPEIVAYPETPMVTRPEVAIDPVRAYCVGATNPEGTDFKWVTPYQRGTREEALAHATKLAEAAGDERVEVIAALNKVWMVLHKVDGIWSVE